MKASVPGARVGLLEQRDIYPHRSTVTRNMRNDRFGHRSGVVWLTGLSGAGKSTLANAVEHRLFALGWQISVLDGDSVRAGLNADLDFTAGAREENLRRAGEVAALFVEAGHLVLASFVSPHQRGRDFVRGILGRDFHLVHVKADLERCVERDPKGLYGRAMQGGIKNFTGVGQSYETPADADLVIDTTDADIVASAQLLDQFILERFTL